MKYLFELFSSKTKGLSIIFGFYVFTHIFFLTLPPKGSHVWRQCHTAMVARNFTEESMNIFQGRVDHRGTSNGVTGMPFPSFEYTVALVAKVIGYSDGLNRVVALCYFGLGIWFFYTLLFLLFKDTTVAFCGTWAFTFSPILYYHSATALTDVVALSASVAGLYYFMRWNEEKKYGLLLFSLFFTTLAGLTKVQYLAIGFPIAILVISSYLQKKYRVADLLLLALFCVVSIGLSLAWYAYAVYMIQTSGLSDFGISFKPAQSLSIGLGILWKNIYTHFTEQLISIPNLIPFAVAVYLVFKEKMMSTEKRWMYGLWAAGLLAYHLIELHQMAEHMYYMFPYLPLIFIVTAKGYGYLLEKKKQLLVLLILISLPIVAIAGTIHNFINDNAALPKDFYTPAQRQALDELIPNDALCLVGPDQSRAIYHYFTHTKGLTFRNTEEFTEQWLKNGIRKGARYLIINKQPGLPKNLEPYMEKKLAYPGTDLDVYLIKH